MMSWRIRISDNYFLDEFIPPEMYQKFGEKSLLWLRPDVVRIAQALRHFFGAVTINNWSHNGEVTAEMFLKLPKAIQDEYFTQSGIRLHNSETGALFSQHKYGCAADLKFKTVDPDTVRRFIVANYHEKFRPLGLRRMEAQTKTWVHVDIGNTGSSELVIFNP